MMPCNRHARSILAAFTIGTTTAASAGSTASSPKEQPTPKMQLVFLGTGSSIGCPRPVCATKNISTDSDSSWHSMCRTSWKALIGDPRNNPNYRNNPSLLVRFPSAAGADGYCNIVIDAGKTFREAVIRWFPAQTPPVASIDAVILTHEHADAMLGLDDVRGAQDPRPGAVVAPMPIFLSRKCMGRVAEAFPYLMPAKKKPLVERFVAKLDFKVVFENRGTSSSSCDHDHGNSRCVADHGSKTAETEKSVVENAKGGRQELAAPRSNSPLSDKQTPSPIRTATAAAAVNRFRVVSGQKDLVEVTVLPVVHGEDCTCLGFAFGSPGNRVVYLSDLSRVPPETWRLLKDESEQGIDVLVLDCLKETPHNTHLSLPESLDLVRSLKPKRAFLVGMSCDSFPPHHEMNRRLESWGTELLLSKKGARKEKSGASSTFSSSSSSAGPGSSRAHLVEHEMEVLAEALSASTKVEFARDGLVVEVDL